MQTNKVTLVGYVGKDLNSTIAINGNKRVGIRMATHYQRKDQDHKWTSQTVWHDIVAWNKRAAFAERSFVKGSKILVEGYIEYRMYMDNSGHKRYITQINAHSLMNLDR